MQKIFTNFHISELYKPVKYITESDIKDYGAGSSSWKKFNVELGQNILL